jgi:hypothetical protein
MKRRSLKTLVLALSIIGFSIPSSFAITTIQGGPYTNLDPAGASIHLNLSNYPTDKGLYIFQVVRDRSATNARPTIINMDNAVDVTTNMSHADIVFKAVGTFTTPAGVTDCSKVECALWAQYDGASGSFSVKDEDQYIASLSFAAATAAALPADTISASINGVSLSSSAPGTLAYRIPVTVSVTTGSGLPATIVSSTADCSVKGNVIEALKVVTAGCDFAISTPGNSTTAGKTTHFPFMVTQAVQKVTQKITKLKIGKIVNLVAKSNFGEGVAYKSTTKKICTVKGTTVVGLKAGNCLLTVNAVGTANYPAVLNNLTLPVSK